MRQCCHCPHLPLLRLHDWHGEQRAVAARRCCRSIIAPRAFTWPTRATSAHWQRRRPCAPRTAQPAPTGSWVIGVKHLPSSPRRLCCLRFVARDSGYARYHVALAPRGCTPGARCCSVRRSTSVSYGAHPAGNTLPPAASMVPSTQVELAVSSTNIDSVVVTVAL